MFSVGVGVGWLGVEVKRPIVVSDLVVGGFGALVFGFALKWSFWMVTEPRVFPFVPNVFDSIFLFASGLYLMLSRIIRIK